MRKTKKLISLLLAVILAVSCITGTAAFSASATASTFTVIATSNLFPAKTATYSDINSYADGNGNIYITVDYDICAVGKQLLNFQFNYLTWDPNVLEFDIAANSVKRDGEEVLTIHPLLREQGYSAITNTNKIDQGRLISNFTNISTSNKLFAYSVDDNDNFVPGTLVRVVFKVIDPTVSTTNINFDMTELSIDDETTRDPLPNKVIDFNGINEEYASMVDFYTKISPVGDVIDIIGDVNLDGNVDVLDATYVQKYSSDKTTLNERQKYVGDVNNDGNVDVLDAADIQKYSADKISEFKKK